MRVRWINSSSVVLSTKKGTFKFEDVEDTIDDVEDTIDDVPTLVNCRRGKIIKEIIIEVLSIIPLFVGLALITSNWLASALIAISAFMFQGKA